jgi:hypothetical protein
LFLWQLIEPGDYIFQVQFTMFQFLHNLKVKIKKRTGKIIYKTRERAVNKHISTSLNVTVVRQPETV